MLNFIHISDTHISADPQYHPPWVHESIPHPNQAVQKLITMIGQLPFPIDFILHTGDVCADPIEANYDLVRGLFQQVTVPIYFLAGNHDSAEMMSRILHDGHLRHVLLDDQLMINGHLLVTLNTNGVGDSHAPSVVQQQIEWLNDTLQTLHNDPIMMAVHHPLITTGVDWIDHRMRVQNGDLIHQCLARYSSQIRGVFHGHVHQAVDSYCDGVLYAGTPSTWYNLQAYPQLQTDEDDLLLSGGFNLVMIRDNRTFIRRYMF